MCTVEPQIELQDASLNHCKAVHRIHSFTFECGVTLPFIDLSYETWGSLNHAADNAVVVCHALTGDAHVADAEIGGKGWWSDIFGPNKVVDTHAYFVVAVNVLGGCCGSTGPASLHPHLGIPYALDFPLVTIRDMVRAQIALLEALGIKQIQYVIGGSLGGMQAWEWALLAPWQVNHAIVVAADATFGAIGIGYNEAMRQAIVCDANWQEGRYYGTGLQPDAGLRAARTIGMLTYRTGGLFDAKFGRNEISRTHVDEAQGPHTCFTTPSYQIESYLRHAGDKLSARFDANSYLYLTRAMDSHDIGRGRGGMMQALRRIRSRITVIGITGDYLYPPSAMQETVAQARSVGVQAFFHEMASPYGHDAFLADQSQLANILQQIKEGKVCE